MSRPKINNYSFTTGMGKIASSNFPAVPFNGEVIKKMDDIGYHHSSNCISLWTNLLDEINPKKTYSITQTKFDDGSFREAFSVVEVVLD